MEARYTSAMSDELPIGDKIYVSSKKAAAATGYAQDYIGQLARGGLIEAQRVGGLWYVRLDSLTGYKANAADFKPQQPQSSPAYDPESIVSFDGKDYISASRAAKVTGYNQDYIGQLARSGKILSRQIGNRWYVDREGLVAHKNDKDKLLAAVQVESVGLARISAPEALRGEYAGAGPVLTYLKEERHDLMPTVAKSNTPVVSPIKIRTLAEATQRTPAKMQPHKMELKEIVEPAKSSWRISDSTMRVATKSVAALTIVVVLSYGLFSLKDSSTYATTPQVAKTYVAGAAESADAFFELLERVLTRELLYVRASQ